MPGSQNVQVDLRSVVDLLSHHLYSGPEVVIRELLQNGVDALHARALHDGTTNGSLQVEVLGEENPTLVVEDDGIGLTEPEIHEFLSTVGKSSKRDELDLSRGDFLGQFGVGLLSCFLVCDEVTVTTQSAKGGPAWTWRGRSDGTYTLSPAPQRSVGTTIYVPLRSGGEELLKGNVLRLVRKYASLLPQEVTFRDGRTTTRVGGRRLPWEVLTGPDLLAWGEEHLQERFLTAIPLQDLASETTGMAFVAAEPLSPGVRQKHSVTLKGMLLSDQATSILPEWAFFARVVIDTRGLHPTASREALVEDDLLHEARDVFGGQVRSWLKQLADTSPAELKDFVALHHASLKALSVYDDQLFDAVHAWLPVETSLGMRTLGELVHYPDVCYATSRDTYRQLLPVSTAQGICLVNGGYSYDLELLERLQRRHPGWTTSEVTPEAMLGALKEVAPGDQAAARHLEQVASDVLSRFSCRVEVKEFHPASMVGLLVVDSDERFRRLTKANAKDVGSFWSDLAGHAQALMPPSTSTLCLNHANTTIHGLTRQPDSPRLRAAIELLYVQSLLMGHHPLDSREVKLLGDSVLNLVKGSQ